MMLVICHCFPLLPHVLSFFFFLIFLDPYGTITVHNGSEARIVMEDNRGYDVETYLGEIYFYVLNGPVKVTLRAYSYGQEFRYEVSISNRNINRPYWSFEFTTKYLW